MMIYTEITPNPASLKFVAGKTILERGTAHFNNAEEAAPSPLARALFELKFVREVFFGANFLTVTKADDFSWEEVIPTVKESIKGFFESGLPIMEAGAEPAEAPVAEGDEDEIVQKIKALLDENIRPAVAMDGGDVVFESFEEGVVKLRMQGACSGCPSSTMTLKMGIEGLLTRLVPEVKTVEAV